jgi:hypothetical protein
VSDVHRTSAVTLGVHEGAEPVLHCRPDRKPVYLDQTGCDVFSQTDIKEKSEATQRFELVAAAGLSTAADLPEPSCSNPTMLEVTRARTRRIW